MSIINVRELIRSAKRDEDVGAVFYEKLAEIVEDPELRARFLKIREQELGHSKRFQQMLEEMSDYTPQEEYAGQYEKYYNSFLSKHEYLQEKDTIEKAEKVGSDIEAIKFALAQEKDTLLFFIEMQKMVPSGQNVDFVQAVIDEERAHVAELSEMLIARM